MAQLLVRWDLLKASGSSSSVAVKDGGKVINNRNKQDIITFLITVIFIFSTNSDSREFLFV